MSDSLIARGAPVICNGGLYVPFRYSDLIISSASDGATSWATLDAGTWGIPNAATAIKFQSIVWFISGATAIQPYVRYRKSGEAAGTNQVNWFYHHVNNITAVANMVDEQTMVIELDSSGQFDWEKTARVGLYAKLVGYYINPINS
jgi:hypothetical protein